MAGVALILLRSVVAVTLIVETHRLLAPLASAMEYIGSFIVIK
jgi:hypothetical protein